MGYVRLQVRVLSSNADKIESDYILRRPGNRSPLLLAKLPLHTVAYKLDTRGEERWQRTRKI
jgi:hypothetical protein